MDGESESAAWERGFSIRTLTTNFKTGQRYPLGDSLLAALMMIGLNGPDEITGQTSTGLLAVEKNYKQC